MNLRSIIAQVTRGGRSILPRRNGMSVGARFLIGGTGVTLGCGLGYLMCGGSVARYEERRQELMREKMWSDPVGKMWSDLRKMWSDRKS